VHVLMVRVDIQQERRDNFLEASIDVTGKTHQNEPGMLIRFDIIQDSTDPNRLFVYEVWRDEQAFNAHLQAPYYKRFGDTVKNWLVAPPQVLCVGSSVFPPESDKAWS
jgi:autoinducer 2-degrading protein